MKSCPGFLAWAFCALAVLAASAEEVRFMAFGDSNTVGHGDHGVRCPDPATTGGYPIRLGPLLAERGIESTFENHGICGNSTTSGLSRIDDVLQRGGDVIVLMQGTIDIARGVSLETILFNLEEMARRAELAGVVPMHVSVIPRGSGAGRDTDNVKTMALARELRELAAKKGRPFADPFSAFFNLPEGFERFYSDPTHPNPQGYDTMANSMVEAAVAAAARSDLCTQVPAGDCVASDRVLCLNSGRFRVEAAWRDFENRIGVGQAVPQTNDTGAFYFFDPQNIELIVKVLDGRFDNDHFWVFYGSLSNVQFSLVISDTETGQCRQYFSPLGTFASRGDTAAF